MLDANEPKVLAAIGPDDLVLDVGGWARCFNRANTSSTSSRSSGTGSIIWRRSVLPARRTGRTFHGETWVARDICDHTPGRTPTRRSTSASARTPWKTSATALVCREMIRVAKRGYIEFRPPSSR